MARAGFGVIGFGIGQEKLAMLHRGETYTATCRRRVHMLAEHAAPIVDTRNAVARAGAGGTNPSKT